MISVSQAYKDLTQSNIRPKVEPKIIISGYDENGKDIYIEWTANNITDFTYKRGIDPIGRELPFMELTWTEIYSGKLDENLFPEKYNNVSKYTKVVLEFHQNLSFYNTWATFFKIGKTWKDLFKTTWKKIKNEISKEIIVFPTLFLTAKPTYKNQKITWKAVDVLSFLEENTTKAFVSNSPFYNPIKYLLINEIGNFSQSEDISNCLTQCKDNFYGDYGTIESDVIFDGLTKDTICQYLQLRNLYLDFELDGSFAPKALKNSQNNGNFTSNTLKEFPEIQKNPNISNYNFKSYSLIKNIDKNYMKTPYFYKTIKGFNVYRVDYDGYGGTSNGEGAGWSLTFDLRKNSDPVEITPINWNASDNIIIGNAKGEVLSEDIKMNPYNSDSIYMRDRFNYLNSYFNNSSTLNFSCLPDLSITTGDIAKVETSLYKNAQPTIKECLIVYMELKYSGTVKQSFKAHEINGGW